MSTTTDAAGLARPEVTDAAFDEVFPSSQRYRSYVHWTPVDVALRACGLLAPASRILDVGSGVGKMCLIGAATTSACWVGVEQNPGMVRTARRAAKRLLLDERASFAVGDVMTVDWSAFDGFYLFNPFAEILFSTGLADSERQQVYDRNIQFVQHQLAIAAAGTRVVTYHGFGGDMPPAYSLIQEDADELCLWTRL